MRNFFGFDIDSALVPGRNALAMANVAQAAYPPGKDATYGDWIEALDAFGSAHGFGVDIFESDQTDTQGCVLADDSLIIVALRGTEMKLRDFMTDADILMVPFCGGHVHEGFLRAFMSVWQDIKLIVSSLRSEQARPVYITGHSLGAALATLCLAKMIDEGIPVWGIATFGSPRVGDSLFKAFLNSAMMVDRHHRYVNNNDIVARLPLESMGYDHVGKAMVISVDHELMVEPSAWARIKDRVHGYIEGLEEHGIDSLEDHGIQSYIDAISDLQ